MELNSEIKRKIDNFFDGISPEEFYNLLIQEYGLEPISNECEFDYYTISKGDVFIVNENVILSNQIENEIFSYSIMEEACCKDIIGNSNMSLDCIDHNQEKPTYVLAA